MDVVLLCKKCISFPKARVQQRQEVRKKRISLELSRALHEEVLMLVAEAHAKVHIREDFVLFVLTFPRESRQAFDSI